MLGRTHSQALLDIVIKVSDGDTGHGEAPILNKRKL
jgi:hypothetical protein